MDGNENLSISKSSAGKFFGAVSQSYDQSMKKRVGKRLQEYERKACKGDRIEDPKRGNMTLTTIKWFHTQAMAFENLKSSPKDAIIFAKEKEDGKRNFLVTNLDVFWNFYVKLARYDRHYYEIIPEFRPCRLYFDIEYLKEYNMDKDCKKVLSSFIDYVLHQIKHHFDITCFKSDILDMDSSSEKKFSRHLILHIQGTLFKNNSECGKFVKFICAEALNTLDATDTTVDGFENAKIKDFIVKNDKDQYTTICDTGVYTKNRNFRVFLSTKFGKKLPLQISNENEFKLFENVTKDDGNDNTRKLWLRDSLICMHMGNISSIDDLDICLLEFHAPIEKQTCYTGQSQVRERGVNSGPSESGYTVSPYPQLDKFMLKQMGHGDIEGRIRRWVSYPSKKRMIYDCGGNRWCGNIGRQHKSNHIYFVVDFDEGVYYQKCHDPDCYRSDYKSEDKPLPCELNPYLNGSEFMIDSFLSPNCSLNDDVKERKRRRRTFDDFESDLEGDELLSNIPL